MNEHEYDRNAMEAAMTLFFGSLIVRARQRMDELFGRGLGPAPPDGGDPFAWRTAPRRPLPTTRSGSAAVEEPDEDVTVMLKGRIG